MNCASPAATLLPGRAKVPGKIQKKRWAAGIGTRPEQEDDTWPTRQPKRALQLLVQNKD
jgi:hypothetical protein